jgi:tetratricopeptide (TPR) repeat protein
LFAAAAVIFAQSADRGVELFEQRKYGEAERVLRDVVSSEPDNARANLYLGLTRLHLNNVADAEGPLKKADEAGATADTKLGLARLYIEQKQLDKADAAIEQAQALNGDHRDLPFYRGMLLAVRSDFKAAAKELDTAIERNPENPYAHYYAGLAYSRLKRPDKMVEHFEAFLRLAPDAPEAAKVKSLLRNIR